MVDITSGSAPEWLRGASTPGEALRSLLRYLSVELEAASQDEKVAAFRDGVEAIRAAVGELTISAEFRASFPGTGDESIMVFAGRPGSMATPVVAFDHRGTIWTGSLESSVGVTNEGRPVFNAFRANRLC